MKLQFAGSHLRVRRRGLGRLVAALLAPLVLLGCFVGGTGPDDDDRSGQEIRVLFIGNSLTYFNDLPEIVQGMADDAGLNVYHEVVANPNWSLEEHWNAGIVTTIREMQPDLVVMQQGPSTLDSSREHLVHWTSLIAPVVREVGGEPGLFMVWPVKERRAEDLARVRTSYRAAAAAVDGFFVPAGDAWGHLWTSHPELYIYMPDGLHPLYLGSLIAAQALAAVLFDLDPSELTDPSGEVPGWMVDAVRAAVVESLDGAVYPELSSR